MENAMSFDRVLITGAAGYVGSKLVPALLSDFYEVIAYDTFWFGDHLPASTALMRVKADIRDIDRLRSVLLTNNVQSVIHLACLSNDPSSEIDKKLTRSINYDAFIPFVEACAEAGVERFIFASTSSVYGVSDAPDVREDHPHVPLTLYNTYKSWCERDLQLFCRNSGMEYVIIRPATICGYSPRQRLDLSVNILTNLAVNKGVITVHGGAQMRPNLHIDDMIDCYRFLLAHPFAAGETFNVGVENVSIIGLARKVARICGCEGFDVPISVEDAIDERSYQVNSDKIARVLNFRPRKSVEMAIHDLKGAFAAGLLPNPLGDARYYNVKRMREVFSELYADEPPTRFRPDLGVLSEIDMLREDAKR
jgi:nucleoside-diphosphate-sugar epimerase